MMETDKIIEMLQDENYRLKQENKKIFDGPVVYVAAGGDKIRESAEIARQVADLLRRPVEVYHTGIYSLVIPPQTTNDELATLVNVALRVPQ